MSHEKVKYSERKLTYDWGRAIEAPPVLSNIKRTTTSSAEQPNTIQIEKKKQRFCTGSSYQGKYDVLGFAGFGVYVYPHGVKYQGYFKDGVFHGEGTLTYPMGQQIDGTWKNGRLKKYVFKFADGLEYGTPPWNYCIIPDRTFQVEVLNGLKPAKEEYLTNAQPTKYLQPNCYDTIDGYFDASTKCIYKDDLTRTLDQSSTANRVIDRLVTGTEEKLITANYRRAEDVNVGFRPDLYEHWTSGVKKEEIELKKIEEDEATSKTISDLSTDPEDYEVSVIGAFLPGSESD